MAIADQIRDLAEQIQNDLTQALSYYYDTKIAWRLVRQFVDEGRPILVRNKLIDETIDGPTLEGRAQGYVTGYLAESVFQHYITLFEDYTFGLIGLWLMAYPRGIIGLDDDKGDHRLKGTDRAVPLSLITDNPDRESILRAVIEQELNRLKYRRPAAWFEYLEDRAKLGLPSKDQIESLAEMKASRDILVHNRGLVNPTYRFKSGSKARYTDGDRLEIIEPYLQECFRIITEVIRETSTRAVEKLERAAPPAPGSR